MSYLSGVTLTVLSIFVFVRLGAGQPSIVDLSFSNTSVTLRWEVQCNNSMEVTRIMYGCTQENSFQESDLIVVNNEVNKSEKFRQRKLSIPNMTESVNWKCVFKLVGVQISGCRTEESYCMFVDVESFSRQTGIITVLA